MSLPRPETLLQCVTYGQTLNPSRFPLRRLHSKPNSTLRGGGAFDWWMASLVAGLAIGHLATKVFLDYVNAPEYTHHIGGSANVVYD